MLRLELKLNYIYEKNKIKRIWDKIVSNGLAMTNECAQIEF